jgi:hypothetical protein
MTPMESRTSQLALFGQLADDFTRKAISPLDVSVSLEADDRCGEAELSIASVMPRQNWVTFDSIPSFLIVAGAYVTAAQHAASRERRGLQPCRLAAL